MITLSHLILFGCAGIITMKNMGKELLKFDKSQHWYDCKGSPEPKHDADLRVARKQNLYPSVTTVDKAVFKNDFLDKWKLEQVVIAASQTFKQPHESDKDYMQRVYEMSLEKANTAATFGKELHDAIEHYPQYPLDTKLHPWLERFGRWADSHIAYPLHKEKILFDHDIGIAGRCDNISMGKGMFEGKVILPDYKSQDVKKDEKGKKTVAFYESWPRQLAFYAVCYAKETGSFPSGLPTCISLVIDSNEPDEPFMRVWTDEEIRYHYHTFCVGAWLWFNGTSKRKPFWPALNGPWSVQPSVPMPT